MGKDILKGQGRRVGLRILDLGKISWRGLIGVGRGNGKVDRNRKGTLVKKKNIENEILFLV